MAAPNQARTSSSGDLVAPSGLRPYPRAIKRAFDIVFSVPMTVLTFPVVVFGAIGVFLSDPGPVLFRAKRVGRDGKLFTLYKLRSMRIAKPGAAAPVITAGKVDPRVFPFGRLIRATKMDELPQFWNVVRGELSVVGPRPEDSKIVDNHYTDFHRQTLSINPGLTSPGSLFTSMHGDDLLTEENAELDYIERLLPLRLALEHVYMRKQNLGYDLWVVWRTVGLIAGTLIGKKEWKEQPETEEARRLLAAIGESEVKKA